MANHVACIGRAHVASNYVGSGKEERWGGLDVYVAGSDSVASAVIFASDIFGYQVPQFRKLADWMAARGFLVLVPDFFHGDPIVPDMDPALRDSWFQRHDASLSLGEASNLVQELRSRGFTTVGAAGFCWGASLVVKMNEVNAIVLAHPAKVTIDDIKVVETPLAVLIGDHDEVTPLDQLKEWKSILQTKAKLKGKILIKVFQDCAHGFLARPATAIEEAAAHEARQDMASFLHQFTA